MHISQAWLSVAGRECQQQQKTASRLSLQAIQWILASRMFLQSSQAWKRRRQEQCLTAFTRMLVRPCQPNRLAMR